MKFKRITAFLLAVLVIFSCSVPLNAFAATEGTPTTIDPSYRCVKGSDTGISGTAPIGDSRYYWHYNAAGTQLNCPIRFMKEKGTSTPVYCIEVGATFDGYTYSTQALTSSPYWTSLSSTAQTGITYTTMYGYPTNNYGAANCDAYAATQTIIWEFAKGYRDLSGRTNAYYYNLMMKGSPAENAYNQLSAAVSSHTTRPSFSYSTSGAASSKPIELKYNAANNNWSSSLSDGNSVLSGYNVASNGGLSVSKSGNTLNVSTTQELTSAAQIRLDRPLPSTNQALLALYSPTSQNAIVGQLKDPVSSYVSFTTEDVLGKVSVTKTDEAGTKLNGVVFGVYSDAGCTSQLTTMTTSNGTATSGDINVSKYPKVYVKEKSMPSDLSAVYVLNQTVYTVTMQRNSTVAANGGKAVVNEWKNGRVKVIKQNENGAALAGVVFGVYSDSGCTSLLTSITTGSDGTGTSAEIDVGTTGQRNVYVRETSITAEQKKLYSMNTTVYPVTIKAGQTVTANSGKAVVNNWLPGKISLVKTNSAGEYLSGAIFTAYSDKECKTVLTDMAGKNVVIKTNSGGSAVSTDIYVGKTGSRVVYVKETGLDNPDSDIIDLNPEVFPVTLQPNVTSQLNGGKAVINQYKPGKLMIVKENQNGNRLAGITFSVYNDKPCRELLMTVVTDEHGVGISGELPIDGTGERLVYVKETSLTAEQRPLYELSNTVYPTTLFPAQTVQVNNGKTIINRWTLGQISLTKQNENGQALEGVTFAIFEDSDCLTPLLGADGKQVTMTTGADGKAVSEGIEVGNNGTRKLYVREKAMTDQLSELYELNTTAYPVVITAGTVAPVNEDKPVVNKWKPGRFSLAKVNPVDEPVAGAEFRAYSDEACSKVLKDTEGKEVKVVTDNNGSAVSADIAVDKNGERTVYLKETAVADKTVQINNNVFTVKITAAKTTAVNDGKGIVDDWFPGKFELSKTDAADKPLEGVTFAAYDDAECGIPAKDVNGAEVKVVTNKDGHAVSESISIGRDGTRTLFVKETAMTADQAKVYALNPRVFEVTITPNTTSDINSDTAVVNEWLPATLLLVKQNENGQALAGVTFGIYESLNCSIPVKDVSGNDAKLVTGEDGRAVSAKIDVGSDGTRTVYVKELSLTDEQSGVYVLSDEVFTVELSAGQNSAVNDGKPVVNKWKPGRFTLRKSNEADGAVTGAEFTAYSDEECTQILKDAAGKDVIVVSNENGLAHSADITVGKNGEKTIFIRETDVTDPLVKLNDTVFTVKLRAGKTTEVNEGKPVIDEWCPGRIELNKVDEAENPLEGVSFGVYDDEECSQPVKDVSGSDVVLVTDKDGHAVSNDIKVNKDGKRTLYVREISVTEEQAEVYALNPKVFEVTISPNMIVSINGGDKIVNEWLPASLSLVKQNENGEALAGVTFAVYEDKECKKLLTDVSGSDVILSTDGQGNASAKDIAVSEDGTRRVYVREISISKEQAEIYSMSKELFEVVLHAGQNSRVNDGRPVVNKWKPGKFILNKADQTGKPVAGAEFTAYSDEACSKVLKDTEGKEVVLVTGENGSAVSSAIAVDKNGERTVYLKETAVADPKLAVNGNVFSVRIAAGKTTAANDGKAIIDDWRPGKIELLKTNEAGVPLEGVTFSVFEDKECVTPAKDASGAEIVLVTDNDGYAISNDVPVSKDGQKTLYVKETAMSEQLAKTYSLNEKVFEVTVMPNMIASVNGGEKVVNEWLSASLSLVKQDEDGKKLAGVTFGVFTDEDCTEPLTVSGADVVLVTDENGCASYSDIPVSADGTRKVYVAETGMIEEQLSVYSFCEDVFTVELTAGQNTAVNEGKPVINRFVKTPVKIRKSDLTTEEGVPGAEIVILDSDGNQVFKGITGEDGETEAVELKTGKYTFVETVAPAGYVLNKAVFEFEVLPDGSVEGELTVSDRQTEWKITKSDVTTAEPLPGAEITIYDSEGKEVYKDITGEDGSITAFKLPAGEYTFKETLAPEGYVLNEEIFKFVIAEDGSITGDNTVTDKKITGGVRITKTDAENGGKLIGAVFGLYSADGETKITEGTTNEDGTLEFSGLAYSSYVVRELEAPEGFCLDETEHKVVIDEDGKLVEVKIDNKPITGTLKITKSDLSDGKLIPNAGFRIKDASGKTVAEGYTDEKGVAEFTLRYGKYTYQEFDAPDGYKIDDREYPFEITEDGQIVSVGMTNELIPFTTPQTGERSFGFLWVLMLVIGLFGTAAAGLKYTAETKLADKYVWLRKANAMLDRYAHYAAAVLIGLADRIISRVYFAISVRRCSHCA